MRYQRSGGGRKRGSGSPRCWRYQRSGRRSQTRLRLRHPALLADMSSSTAITTFLRLRPVKQTTTSHFVPPVADEARIECRVPETELPGFVNHKRTNWNFAFNGILNAEATQEEVFDCVAQPVVESVLEGYNGTVFAYGQTGSGKTYTLTGGASAYAERGIIPRTLSAVFKAIASRQDDAEHTVRISYLEIYNESGFDLLDPRQAAAAGRHGSLGVGGLAELAKVSGVVEDEDGSVRLKGLSSHVVASEEAAINLLFLGDTNRAVSETSMNAVSSRSHCIFTIAVEARPHGSTTVRRSKLHLVDLAGSERVGKSGASGNTLTEALSINVSLHFLEMVIMALHEKQKKGGRHVPYRNSMLTSVLRDSLGGNCKTVMVATVHPAAVHTDESISTCKFAQRVAMVKNDVSRNEEVDHAALVARLREENRALRESGAFGADDGKSLTADEIATLHAEVRTFVGHQDPQATIAWGRGKRAARVKHALWILKGLLLDGWRPPHAPPASAWTTELSPDREGAPPPSTEGLALASTLSTEGHGPMPALDSSEGADPHGYRSEPPRASAGGGVVASASVSATAEGEHRSPLLLRVVGAPPMSHEREAAALGSVDGAFGLFCTGYEHGASLIQRQRDARSDLRAQVERAQAVGHSLRAARDAVAAAKGRVEARRVSLAVASVLPAEASSEWHHEGLMDRATAVAAGSGQAIPAGAHGVERDEEELRLCAELQREKERYRALADELKRLKHQCAALQARSDSLHAASEAAFRQWWPLACEEHGVPPPPPSAASIADSGSQPPAPTPHAYASDDAARKRGDALGSQGRCHEAWGDGLHPAVDGYGAAPHVDSGMAAGVVDVADSSDPPHGGIPGTGAPSAPWLALLNDPEAALAEFRASHWDSAKVRARDELKQRLSDAYAHAKESGERVARKRHAVSDLKAAVAAAESNGAESEDAERLRCKLQLDMAMYKGAVSSLKEVKSEIETLQAELQRSQVVLQTDFQKWHAAALVQARAGVASVATGGRAKTAARALSASAARQQSQRMGMAIACRDATNDAWKCEDL